MKFVVNTDNASAKNIFFFKISLSISQDIFVSVPLGQLSSEVVRLIPLLVKKKAEGGRKKEENFLKGKNFLKRRMVRAPTINCLLCNGLVAYTRNDRKRFSTQGLRPHLLNFFLK